MSNIKRQCNIDLFAKADRSLHSPCVHVNQYDYGYDIAFYIFDNYANPFKIDNGSVVIITGTKKDKKGFQYECSYKDNEVILNLNQQITVFSGRVESEITIIKDGIRIGTSNFYFIIEQSSFHDDTVVSESDLSLMAQAEGNAISAKEFANKASEYAREASDKAALLNGHTLGTDVPEDAVFTDTSYQFNQNDDGDITVTGSDGSVKILNHKSKVMTNEEIRNMVNSIYDQVWGG